ncbi:acetylornithine deacetylase [Xanthobacter sp. KR7-65]|uniref:acetylornithine deacetylase n=1 Tax=Xanthobacter sp. KR7-65 TaxID=3156612 RepID=UPI0032B3D227
MQVSSEEILEKLIAIPSITDTANEEIVACIEKIAAPFARVRRLPGAPGDRAALLLSVGPHERPGVVLSAHTDVVAVAGQPWSSDPFVLTEREGRLYGRGTSDMKGFVACVLAALPAFAAARLETPVHVALSYDEEIGCKGAGDLVALLARLPAPPALCIVGEPSGMKVMRAHKGKTGWRVTARGRTGHSALPHRAANAVTALARLAAHLADLAADLKAGARDEAFDPPYATLHIGSLHGGAALNVVPDEAVMEFELRTIPGTDGAAILRRIEHLAAEARAALKAEAEEADLVVEELSSYPALATAADTPEAAAVARLCGDNGPPGTIAFGTEAGLYDRAGLPTLVCGPGDIARAHKADEWVGRDELAQCDAMLARLVEMCRRPASEWITR